MQRAFESTKASDEKVTPERPQDLDKRKSLMEFGKYCGECLPKFIQQIQLTHFDELELLIAPDRRTRSQPSSRTSLSIWSQLIRRNGSKTSDLMQMGC